MRQKAFHLPDSPLGMRQGFPVHTSSLSCRLNPFPVRGKQLLKPPAQFRYLYSSCMTLPAKLKASVFKHCAVLLGACLICKLFLAVTQAQGGSFLLHKVRCQKIHPPQRAKPCASQAVGISLTVAVADKIFPVT